jgi:hypothetical protein
VHLDLWWLADPYCSRARMHPSADLPTSIYARVVRPTRFGSEIMGQYRPIRGGIDRKTNHPSGPISRRHLRDVVGIAHPQKDVRSAFFIPINRFKNRFEQTGIKIWEYGTEGGYALVEGLGGSFRGRWKVYLGSWGRCGHCVDPWGQRRLDWCRSRSR